MINLEWITGNWTWFLAPLSIIGVLLNNKKDKRCFFFWIITNFYWMIVDFQAHKFDTRLLAQSAGHAIFFIISLIVTFSWKKIEKDNGGDI